ncbi:hypothetical protein [Rathayibacter sp. AY1D9]|uniref:hypothetical protein n=1 Tax=Rathayibacter sp. AY1D9 TaxID=2080548 RepID=UPI000CE8195D|nr:hypothetical protein [Rathayibacter sp. AY1D9]PPH78614.1 hypothetical protein C5C50_14350 [Rathayibacter sp. AY1D9]
MRLLIRTLLTLVAVAGVLSLATTSVLFALSSLDTGRDAGELLLPLARALLATAVTAAVGGLPYSAGRGRAPWPVLWSASTVCILAIAWIVVSIAAWTDAGDGTDAVVALLTVVPAACCSIAAVPVTELVLRVGTHRIGAR